MIDSVGVGFGTSLPSPTIHNPWHPLCRPGNTATQQERKRESGAQIVEWPRLVVPLNKELRTCPSRRQTLLDDRGVM
jgi:hypothetical protein